MAADLYDTRVLVPRARRAMGDSASDLTDTQVNERVADALAGILLYSGGQFGHTLTVTDRDGTSGAPTAWKTSGILTEQESTVVAIQAAIDYLTLRLSEIKTQESISDEGQSWEYQHSANALTQQIKALRQDRDRAVEEVLAEGDASDTWVNLLAQRDSRTDALVEPGSDSVGGLPVYTNL